MKRYFNPRNGITLVALVLTIVILLVIATVTIGTINGGLFEYAGKAISIADLSTIIEQLQAKEIIKGKNNLNGSLEQVLGSDYSRYNSIFRVENGKLIYLGDDPKIVQCLFELGQKEDSIENPSAICAIKGHDFKEANYLYPQTCRRCGATNGQKLVATAPHSNQQNSEDIGIGTDGQLVNLDNWTYVKESGTWRLTGYTGQYSEQGEIEGVVPQVIGGINVTSMAGTFKNNTNLVIAPEIPTTVKNMTEAFYGCTQLTQASLIPYGVTNVNKIFQGCSGLVTLPDGFTLPDSITGRNTMQVFYQCTNLKELPDSFRVSNNSSTVFYMFYQCSNLEKLPEGFTIPNSVSEMLHVFDGCSKLSELPDSFRLPPNRGTPDAMFKASGITKLPDGFTIPEGWTSINYMFCDCNKLEYLPEGFTIPSTMQIMDYALQGCSKITSLPDGFRVPQGVTSMMYTFYKCSNLKNLPSNFTIPASVSKMNLTFRSCPKLEGTITFLGNPSDVYLCLEGAATTSNGLTINYTSACTNIDALRATVTSGANITFVEIPTATE